MQDLMFTVGFADSQGATSALLLPGDNLGMMEEPGSSSWRSVLTHESQAWSTQHPACTSRFQLKERANISASCVLYLSGVSLPPASLAPLKHIFEKHIVARQHQPQGTGLKAVSSPGSWESTRHTAAAVFQREYSA